jgi:ribosome-associated toxin RatA of RatAB toxin-antitoxin module
MKRVVMAFGVAVALLGISPVVHAGESVASKRVAHAPDLVWATLNDVRTWRRFFPPGAEVRIEPLGGDRHHVRASTEMAGLRVRYAMIATMRQDQCQVQFELDPSHPADLRYLESTWHIRAVPGGGSEIVLRVESESGMPIPGFLERRLTDASARSSVEALVAELAERAARDALLPPP